MTVATSGVPQCEKVAASQFRGKLRGSYRIGHRNTQRPQTWNQNPMARGETLELAFVQAIPRVAIAAKHGSLRGCATLSGMLLCTVRDCRLDLLREGSRLYCPNGHSFDVSRHGYVNLLQPQDKKSRTPGDSAAAVAARRRLHDRNTSAPLLQAITEILRPEVGEKVLDVGCGEGYFLGSLAKEHQVIASGVDLSAPAVQAAARRYPNCEWVVANADRFLPFADHCFRALLSITSRLHPQEFQRVLHPEGRLLVAVPAPEDLMELRGAPGAHADAEAAPEGFRLARDRTERVIEELKPAFRLAGRRRATNRVALDADAVQDVLVSIYRPFRAAPVTSMDLTFSLDILLFQRA